MAKGKGLIRSLNRRGTRTAKKPAGGGRARRVSEPTICDRCAAVFSRQTWRRDHRITDALLSRAVWTTCPACRQARAGEYVGRVLVRGAYLSTNEGTIRARIANVAAQADAFQPERKLVSIERSGAELEVLTTSQQLAHRIVHELKKAFRGRVSFAWSDDDGSLLATWQRDDVPAAS